MRTHGIAAGVSSALHLARRTTPVVGSRQEQPAPGTSTKRGHEIRHAVVNGHRRAFLKVGRGPVLLLLHGIGCDHRTWDPVVEQLAREHTVIVPDLLGHGMSDKPRADYSLGGYANGMRDLLAVLGIRHVTVVGHSFGGGVAMQFSYQFPDMCDRVVLVSTGGLGREVAPALRAVTLPGFHQLMGVWTLPGIRHLNVGVLRTLGRTGLPRTRDLAEVARVLESFTDPRARAATRHVVRGVIDLRGQVVTMGDRAYLAAGMPICVVWGAEDHVIPVSHALRARTLAPWARLEVLPESGHFPHKDHPQRFARIVEEFVATTEPNRFTRREWRRMLRAGAPGVRAEVEAPSQERGARERRAREDRSGAGNDEARPVKDGAGSAPIRSLRRMGA